jgi:hypothetical protein
LFGKVFFVIVGFWFFFGGRDENPYEFQKLVNILFFGAARFSLD